MAGKVGRPKVKDIELNADNKQAILDYIKQGFDPKDIAKELGCSVKPVRKVYNRYLKEVEEGKELERMDKVVSGMIETTVTPRLDRVSLMHEMLNQTVASIYKRNTNEDGELEPLDSGDFNMILKLLKDDEATIMSTGRLQTVKKKNNDNRHFFNKEKMLKVDEMNHQYKDTSEDDILLVEDIIKDLTEEE